ncbi:hypothetical protein [Taibaiella chishuiensis]|uniref:Uncharacterized protein n=1 Tax=Taibaiella chishuiensis TaxID=1434707 RepID=A0A2P8D341_9BACT|nr:hypothetical protein [Taibaiella chishuiensis]PSK91633.1 hypothetical protein B0I18_105218 [Taibaiella chishuiensis]
MLKLISISIFVYLFYKIYKSLKGTIKKRPRISAAPETFHPIASSEETFHHDEFKEFPEPIPEIGGGWLSMGKDKRLLNEYAERLDQHGSTIRDRASRAIVRFRNDNEQLNSQQLQLFRRIYQSKRLLKRFPELKRQRITAGDLPVTLRIMLPSNPSFLNIKQLNKSYDHTPVKAGQAVGKILTTHHGLNNNQKIIGVAIAMVAVAVKSKSNISKLKRELESVRGQVSSYAISMKTTIMQLGKSHMEIVALSGQLKTTEAELIQLVKQAAAIPPNKKSLSSLSPDEAGKLRTLYFLMLQAEQYGKTHI